MAGIEEGVKKLKLTDSESGAAGGGGDDGGAEKVEKGLKALSLAETEPEPLHKNTVKVDNAKRPRFTTKCLFYEKTLEELVEEGLNFRIVSHHNLNYSIMDIFCPEESEDYLFHLDEEINEYFEETPDVKFTKKPKMLEIVLAQKPGDNRYRRCVISDYVWKKECAEVYFIDVGGTEKVEWTKLKPVNEEIMKYPRLAYSVILDDMYVGSDLILDTAYDMTMKKLQKVDFKVEFGGPISMPGNLYCTKMVKMTYQKPGQVEPVDLRDEISALKVWEWEQFSKLKGTDDEICKKGKFGRSFRKAYPDDEFPFPYNLNVSKCPMPATVAKVSINEKDHKVANLSIFLLTETTYYNYFKVLHHQMARYARFITPSKYFPAIGEAAMVKLADKEKYKGKIKCLGKWIRAVRLNVELLYLIDFDDFLPFTQLQGDLETRQLYYEFFKVPCLLITVRPTENGKPIPAKKAEKIFEIGKRFTFVVTKDREETSVYSPYDVTFADVPDSERDTAVEHFMFGMDQID